MKIAAAVILFNPDEAAYANINSYYNSVEKLFVFDNSEQKSIVKDKILELSKIEFYQDFENAGIAKRLNEACEKAIAQGYDWLLTMDQDSSFTNEMVSAYINCFNGYNNKENVAVFGVEFTREAKHDMSNCIAEAEEKVITSGSLLNLNLFRKVNGFDEALFIDAVDYDYCFRAKMEGYSIVKFSNIKLDHPIGKEVYRSSIKTLFLYKKKKDIHSPLRCYYMYRNMLYLKNKYYNKDEKYFSQIKKYVHSRIRVSMLYGRNSSMIRKYLKKAKQDFKNNNMGRISYEL